MRISIVIPFRNEAANVAPVLREVRQHHPAAEVIAVDDHSEDGTLAALRREPGVEVISLARHGGQSAALLSGLRRASGDVCVLLDGDGQSSAADIKLLLERIPEFDCVVGRRVRRADDVARRAASRLANGVRGLVTGDGVRDTGGTPKALKRECVEALVPFDGFHRFVPALLVQAGYSVCEVDVAHRRRLHGGSHYDSWRRGLRGALDLLGVWWLGRRRIEVAARTSGRDENDA